ncbi:MAG: DHH family phosphoesterase [bacterium]|nr:DHH family phosphoesterase [bacterium]
MALANTLALKIKEKIQPARRVCFIMHAKPDHDTVGSALALAATPDFKDKAACLFCPTPLPAQLLILPKAETIENEAEQVIRFNPDLIIALDASDTQVSGIKTILPRFAHPPQIINIDHHKTNTGYGDLNAVDAEAASTTQIIFYLFQEWNIAITKEMADYLLLGLMTDTSGFSNPATTSQALNAAGQLMNLGANVARLQNYLLTSHSTAFFQQLGRILQDITVNDSWKIVFVILKEAELQKNGLGLEEVAGLTNLFNFLREGDIALLIKETLDGHLQCSMRALKKEIDVSRLAKILGGGGHSKAAGFTIRGKIVKMGEGWVVE